MAAIFFDLDGTLLEFDRAYSSILSAAFRSVGGESRRAWVDGYSEAFFEAFEACEPEPYRRAFDAIDVAHETELLVEALQNQEVSACQPSPDVHSALDRLAGEFELGVVTNGVPDWQREKLRAYDLEERFDVIVASYAAGAHKPDPAPFRLAEQRLPTEKYTMVGDDDADIAGANAVGWSSIRYTGGGFATIAEELLAER
ncbi:HAD family hydrolase [Halocatena halophila]|uniref:HAD family hydrolase n=1 Tax=Halocatena halophila TaxID=2814576 RepID=UPI002ED2113B